MAGKRYPVTSHKSRSYWGRRPTTAKRTTRRRTVQGAPWASLFFLFLLLLFLGITAYATVVVYKEARTAIAGVRENIHISIPLPKVENPVLGQEPSGPTPPVSSNPGQIPPNPVTPQPTPKAAHLPIASRVNILLVGIDKRPQEQGPPRTDTIILLSVDMKHGDTAMISIPRDLWVEIAPYHIHAKINQAYAIGTLRKYPGGGMALLKNTVAQLTGYPVHYYAMVDFNGFRKLIDLIGGIEVCVPKTIHDEQFPTDDYGVETLHIEAGCQHMDGELALKYARTRHADSDYGRARRQQQVILAARDKILQARMLPTLLMRAPQILRNLSGSLETDIPIDRLVTLARIASKISPDQIRREVIDNRYGEETYAANGAWILKPDMEKLRPLFDSMLAPQTPTDEVKALRKLMKQRPAPDLSVRAEDAAIVVLDGSGRPDAAVWVAQWLLKQGFRVTHVGLIPSHTYAHTLLLVRTQRPATQKRLLSLLRVRPENVLTGKAFLGDADMEIIIGRDMSLPR